MECLLSIQRLLIAFHWAQPDNPATELTLSATLSIGLCSSLVECYNSLSPSLWFAMSCEAIGVLLGTSA